MLVHFTVLSFRETGNGMQCIIHAQSKQKRRISQRQHAKVRRTGRGGMLLDAVDARTAADDVPEDTVGCS